MEQPGPPHSESHDVLSLGEGRVPRWARFGTILVVLMVGMAAYRVLSGPSDPAAPEPAAAAQEAAPMYVVGGRAARGTEGARRGAVIRLRGDLVPLRGPGVQRQEREASATVLGRLGPGWLVKLTSTACQDKSDVQTSYGFALASGLFIPWTSSHTQHGRTWRSPDHLLVLRPAGKQLVVHRTSTHTVVAEFSKPRG